MLSQLLTAGVPPHLQYIKPGLTEDDQRRLENYMLSNGADALSFGSIIASGLIIDC